MGGRSLSSTRHNLPDVATCRFEISVISGFGKTGKPPWVAVLSQSRQSLPRTSSRHVLGLEHHGGTQLLQSIGVASQSIGGLTPPLLNRPSVYRVPMTDRCRDLSPVHWRAFASVHRGLHHPPPPVHRRASSPSEDLSSLIITHHDRRAMKPVHWLSAYKG